LLFNIKISEASKHRFKALFDFLISETEVIETEVYAGVDGPGPFKGKNSIHHRIKSLRHVLNMVKQEEFRRFIFFNQEIDHVDSHIFFGFEIMNVQ
jgi:hypothetical protein